MLDPDNWNNPFAPFAIFQGRRSLLPEDLDDEQRELLRRIAGLLDDSDDPSLRARVCDVCWYLDRSDTETMIQAIESYSQVALDAEGSYGGGREEWHRGLELVIRRRASGSAQLTTMAEMLLTRLETVESKDGFFGGPRAGDVQNSGSDGQPCWMSTPSSSRSTTSLRRGPRLRFLWTVTGGVGRWDWPTLRSRAFASPRTSSWPPGTFATSMTSVGSWWSIRSCETPDHLCPQLALERLTLGSLSGTLPFPRERRLVLAPS